MPGLTIGGTTPGRSGGDVDAGSDTVVVAADDDLAAAAVAAPLVDAGAVDAGSGVVVFGFAPQLASTARATMAHGAMGRRGRDGDVMSVQRSW